jgi:hypothetical protein
MLSQQRRFLYLFLSKSEFSELLKEICPFLNYQDAEKRNISHLGSMQASLQTLLSLSLPAISLPGIS